MMCCDCDRETDLCDRNCPDEQEDNSVCGWCSKVLELADLKISKVPGHNGFVEYVVGYRCRSCEFEVDYQ